MELWIIITIAVAAVALLAVIASGYVKAPPDKAFIISGLKKEPKILIGRAGIKFPFLERKDTLVLKQISIDIKTNGYVPTLDFIGVDIDAVAKVRVKTDPEGIKLAMKNFLNMTENQIIEALTDSLQGNMREIIGTVRLKELNTDRKKFGDEVQSKAQTDMNALGIEIISCNIQRIEDEKGLIIALGQDNMSQIQKDASIAKAQADKDVAIAEAEAKRLANEAQVAAETEIAARRNDLRIREAELKKQSDLKQAEADAAYEIQQQEQRKTIEIATAKKPRSRRKPKPKSSRWSRRRRPSSSNENAGPRPNSLNVSARPRPTASSGKRPPKVCGCRQRRKCSPRKRKPPVSARWAKPRREPSKPAA